MAYGPFALGTLAPGAVEEVSPRVLREQLAGLIAPANMPKGDRAAFKPSEPQAAKRGARTRTKAPAEPAPPKVYKTGWARPKKRAGPAAKTRPSSAGPSPRRPG